MTDDMIEMTRAALDRWGKGDPQGALDLYAPDITYMDPFQERRVDGIAAMEQLYSAIAGKVKIARCEMSGAKVQRHGDVAILTFQLMSDVIHQPDGPGNIRVPWNCTQVYVILEGTWKVVHEHWSFIQPEPKSLPIP
ncbi:MAG TPA: nuclear transport factor 2 family protein [Bryobacteraceae bacterium]|nr:nuclear transport factor 2 family protein [Bryobacteraceae bacterium]